MKTLDVKLSELTAIIQSAIRTMETGKEIFAACGEPKGQNSRVEHPVTIANTVMFDRVIAYCRENFKVPISFGYHEPCQDLTFFSDSGRSLDEFALTREVLIAKDTYREWVSKMEELPESLILVGVLRYLMRDLGFDFSLKLTKEFDWAYEAYGALILR